MQTVAYPSASPNDSLGVCMIRRIGSRKVKHTVPAVTERTVRKKNMVPMKRPIFFRSPSPIIRAMITCPALANPMATNVRKFSTSPPTDTAERPTFPILLPTITMSTVL